MLNHAHPRCKPVPNRLERLGELIENPAHALFSSLITISQFSGDGAGQTFERGRGCEQLCDGDAKRSGYFHNGKRHGSREIPVYRGLKVGAPRYLVLTTESNRCSVWRLLNFLGSEGSNASNT